MNNLEILLEQLKDEVTPFEIFQKAFLDGYYLKPYQVKEIQKILKERRVTFVKKKVTLNNNPNEFLSWIDDNDRKKLLELINKLDCQKPINNYFKDLKCLSLKKEKSIHKIYRHDLVYLIRKHKVNKLVINKQFRVDNYNDLNKLHCLLFNEDNYASNNEIYMNFDDGKQKLIYHCAKDKEKEIIKAFDLYKKALKEDDELALVWEICLYLKLIRIHPFIDGNGRTLREMLLIRLYQLGYKNILSISFDALKKEYQDSYLANSDIHLLYQDYQRVIEYEDPILYRNFAFYILKLLIVGQNNLY